MASTVQEILHKFVIQETERQLKLALDLKLINQRFIKKLQVKVNPKNRISRGGTRKDKTTGKRYPFINITTRCVKETLEAHAGFLMKNELEFSALIIPGHVPLVFKEYARIAKDPEIGDFIMTLAEWEKYYVCLIAHELAHAIDNSRDLSPVINGKPWKYYRPEVGGHDTRWRNIYKTIRLKALEGEEEKTAQQAKEAFLILQDIKMKLKEG